MNIVFVFILIVVSEIKIIIANYDGIINKINNYFKTDTFKTLQQKWQPERRSFENAIVLILLENYNRRDMNVYVRKSPDSFKMSNGFHFSDNVVDVVMLDTHLQYLPNLISPDVTFALASNYFHIESELDRMIIQSNYVLFRNQSQVVFSGTEQDPSKNSPFSFQQVHDSGELTITADECSLVGYTITSLSAESVNLGLDTFKVTNCKFNIEIYSAGLGSPPVFGRYFSKEQSETLEMMLRNPIRAELVPKLQAAFYSYINSSSIYGDKLPELRSRQNDIFKASLDLFSFRVRDLIEVVVHENRSMQELKPIEVSWKTCLEDSCKTSINLTDMNLYGLDTAYSAHAGGPYKLQHPKIADEIRFSTMQVRGKLVFANATIKAEHDFSVELRDVAVNVEMELTKEEFVFDFVGWRGIEFSIMDFKLNSERKPLHSFITGHLLNEVPNLLVNQLSRKFGEAKIDVRLDESDVGSAQVPNKVIEEKNTDIEEHNNTEIEELNEKDIEDSNNTEGEEHNNTEIEELNEKDIEDSNNTENEERNNTEIEELNEKEIEDSHNTENEERNIEIVELNDQTYDKEDTQIVQHDDSDTDTYRRERKKKRGKGNNNRGEKPLSRYSSDIGNRNSYTISKQNKTVVNNSKQIYSQVLHASDNEIK